MKLIFYTNLLKAFPGSGHPDFYTRHAKAVGAVSQPFDKYLCSWLSSDIDTVNGCVAMLSQIIELENGTRDLVLGGGNAWFVEIYREHVQFELQTSNDHLDWPIWKCSLIQVKAALTGWKQFLAMQLNAETLHTIELPAN